MTNFGQDTAVTVPSGKVWTIRETNGEDDAILSKLGDTLKGKNIYNFLSSIIVSPVQTPAQVAEWFINDIYYLLFKQRIINQGAEFIFPHVDPEDTKNRKVEYTEDLNEIDADLSDVNYIGGDNKVSRYITPELDHLEYESNISKSRYRIKRFTGLMEEREIDTPQTELTKNTILISREISELVNGQWLRLTSFRKVPSREMAELRAWVKKVDTKFNPMVYFTNKFTNNKFEVPLFSLPTFYYPEETM